MAKGLGYMVYEETLRELDFLNLENRKLKGDLTVFYNYLIREYKVNETSLLRNAEHNNRWQRMSCSMGKSDYILGETFIGKVIKHWRGWHEDIAQSPSLIR